MPLLLFKFRVNLLPKAGVLNLMLAITTVLYDIYKLWEF
jgi:hypothetical protein